ncbi:MAG: hypothetical protein AB7C90_01080 [Bacteroidales bacterium]
MQSTINLISVAARRLFLRLHQAGVFGLLLFASLMMPSLLWGVQKEEEPKKPLMKEFIGINGHFTFKPELYGQLCRMVRNYHNVNWDVKKPGNPITIPVCANYVNWETDLYGPWKRAGFETDISVQFSGFEPPTPNYHTYWAGQETWTFEYGKALAGYFGPSGHNKLCTSIEIGNEPGSRFQADSFKTLFVQMASGIRAGDPLVKIVTPAVQARNGDDYAQDLRILYADTQLLPLYDVINLHTYATIERTRPNESPWNRTFPEDTTVAYMKVVDEAIEWRNRFAPGKEIWITEFGYDACTPEAMEKRKDWSLKLDWQGNTDRQQAQYLVRSLLAFAKRDVERAYLFFYNDNDEPGVHASSGLTRHFTPKMSFWAVKQLYTLLGEYRFSKSISANQAEILSDNASQQPIAISEFTHGSQPDKKIWVAWSPTGSQTHRKTEHHPRQARVILSQLPGNPVKLEAMATKSVSVSPTDWRVVSDKKIELTVTESPVYILFGE